MKVHFKFYDGRWWLWESRDAIGDLPVDGNLKAWLHLSKLNGRL